MENKQPRSRHSYGNTYDSGYEQAYGQANDLDREYKKSQLLDEFQQDRDFIIVSIQSALKTGQYSEARSLVERYRPVADGDREFQILVRMTDKGLSANDYIVQLDATSDNAYASRIVLCQKILELSPGLEEYQKELERCQRLRSPAAPSRPTPRPNCHDDALPARTCPRCGNHKIRIVERSELTGAGVFWLIMLIIFFFPLFFIPLLACRRTYLEHYCGPCRRRFR